MAEHVLVPYDGSHLARRGLEFALENFPDAEITTMYVFDPLEAVFASESGGPEGARAWETMARERSEGFADEVRSMVDDSDIGLRHVDAVGKPGREIVAWASENGVDLIVIGSHGRTGIERAVLGSVADTVTRRATVPVTVVR